VYRFICVDHAQMQGKVTVLNADGTLPVETTPTPTATPTARPRSPASNSTPRASPRSPRRAFTVKVADNFFSPKTATVARGGTVTWRWTGKKSHDVVGPGFKSKTATFTKTFTKKGRFKYLCTLHRGMTGIVRVK
jgi:plastocyanin